MKKRLLLVALLLAACPPTKSPTPPIGPSGGTVTAEGVTLEIPPGALSQDTVITITRVTDASLGVYVPYSPVFRFEPTGTLFKKPARLIMAYQEPATRPAVFTSTVSGKGFRRLGGSVASGQVTVRMTHFSDVFVGSAPDTPVYPVSREQVASPTGGGTQALFSAAGDFDGNGKVDEVALVRQTTDGAFVSVRRADGTLTAERPLTLSDSALRVKDTVALRDPNTGTFDLFTLATRSGKGELIRSQTQEGSNSAWKADEAVDVPAGADQLSESDPEEGAGDLDMNDPDQPVSAGGLYSPNGFPTGEVERPLSVSGGRFELGAGLALTMSTPQVLSWLKLGLGVDLTAKYGLSDKLQLGGGTISSGGPFAEPALLGGRRLEVLTSHPPVSGPALIALETILYDSTEFRSSPPVAIGLRFTPNGFAPLVRLTDLNQNGLPDVVIAGQRSGVDGVWSFEVQPDGSLGDGIILYAGRSAITGVEIVDVDDDGLADLQVDQEMGLTGYVRLGRGGYPCDPVVVGSACDNICGSIGQCSCSNCPTGETCVDSQCIPQCSQVQQLAICTAGRCGLWDEADGKAVCDCGYSCPNGEECSPFTHMCGAALPQSADFTIFWGSTHLSGSFHQYRPGDEVVTKWRVGNCTITDVSVGAAQGSTTNFENGTVTVSGPGGTLTATPAADKTYYASIPQTVAQPGELVTISTTGGEAPALAPTSVVVGSGIRLGQDYSAGLDLDGTTDLTVTWSGGTAGVVSLFLVQGGNNREHQVLCSFPASAGAGTIPAAQLAGFSGPVSLTVRSASRTNAAAGAFAVTVSVLGGVSSVDGGRVFSIPVRFPQDGGQDAGAVDAGPPDAGSAASQALRQVREALDGGAVNVSVSGAVVTYLKPDAGAEPAGFFLQADSFGPALFVAIDPATLSPAPAVGDAVELTVTGVTAVGGMARATSVSGYARLSAGNAVSGLVQDITQVDVTAAPENYDSELVRVTGSLSGSPTAASDGFSTWVLSTPASPNSAFFKLRLPTPFISSMDLAASCNVTLNPTPLWRVNQAAQPTAWRAGELTVNACARPQLSSAAPTSSTSVLLTFSRLIDPSSITNPATQFVFTGGLVASAVSVNGKSVTVTTSSQTPGAAYSVSATATVKDTYGNGANALVSMPFTGFVTPAVLLINEVNANISGGGDLIELLVVSAGSTEGMTLERNATDATYLALATLPALPVQAGDFIVVHQTPVNGETTETVTRGDCTATNCFASAWDVAGTFTGLPLSNVVVTLRNAGRQLIDAVPFYKSNLASPQTTAPNFPVDLQTVQAAGQWLPADCSGAPCTYASTPGATSLAVEWGAPGTSASGNSVQRRLGQSTHTLADWAASVPGTFGAANPP